MKTVKDLMDHLSRYPSDFKIVLAGDTEGNNFSYIDEITVGRQIKTDTWFAEFDDSDTRHPDAICIWPTI